MTGQNTLIKSLETHVHYCVSSARAGFKGAQYLIDIEEQA